MICNDNVLKCQFQFKSDREGGKEGEGGGKEGERREGEIAWIKQVSYKWTWTHRFGGPDLVYALSLLNQVRVELFPRGNELFKTVDIGMRRGGWHPTDSTRCEPGMYVVVFRALPSAPGLCDAEVWLWGLHKNMQNKLRNHIPSSSLCPTHIWRLFFLYRFYSLICFCF